MSLERVLACVFASGCATSLGAGGEVITAPSHGTALTATASAGIGIAGDTSATMAHAGGSFGLTTNARLHGGVVAGFEHIRFGHDAGWQIGIFDGGSLGDVQSSDVIFGLTGGPHWNLARTIDGTETRITSIALDAVLGYAFHVEGTDFSRDGTFLGISVTFRLDTLYDAGIDPNWKPVN